MTHQDIMTLVVFIGGALMILTGWLWRHSTRLTTTEVKIENNIQNIRDNAYRADTQFASIQAALHRIEDKMDRQYLNNHRVSEP